MNKLYNADCLEVMPQIPDKSVDMVLCDLPYGKTACKWDSIIPTDLLWEQYNRIVKENGAIILFASQPFTNTLINSNPKEFRYTWIWDKGRGSNFQLANKQPMKCHEDICVFYKKQPTYNPQYWYSKPYKTSERKRKNTIEGLGDSSAGNVCTATVSEDGRRFPLSILRFPKEFKSLHPSQKPVALCEYLIKTYTEEGQVVLDNCAGSGSTLVAAMNTNRRFIGIEEAENFFKICKKRLDKTCKTA